MWRNAPAKAAIFLFCWLFTHRPAALSANVVPSNVWYQQNGAGNGGENWNDFRNEPVLGQLSNANSQLPSSLQPQANNNYHQPPPRKAQEVNLGRAENQDMQRAFNQQEAGQLQQFPLTQNPVVEERSATAGDGTYPTSTNPVETQGGQQAFNQQVGQIQPFPSTQNSVPKESAASVSDGIYSNIPVYTLPHDEKMQRAMAILPHQTTLWNDAVYPAAARSFPPIQTIPLQPISPRSNEGMYKTMLGQSSPNNAEASSSLRLPWGSERSNQLYVPFSDFKPNLSNYKSIMDDQEPGKGDTGSPTNIRMLNTLNSGDSSFFPSPEIPKSQNFFYNRNPAYVTPQIATPFQNNLLQTDPGVQSGGRDGDMMATATHPPAITDVVGNTIYPDTFQSMLLSQFPNNNQNQSNYNSSRTLDEHNQKSNDQVISGPQYMMPNRNFQLPVNPTLIASPQLVMKEDIFRSRNNQVNILPLPPAFFTPRDISTIYPGDFGPLPAIQSGRSVIPLINNDNLRSLSLHPISSSIQSFEGPYLTGPISKDYHVIHPAYTGQFSIPALGTSPVRVVSMVQPLGSAGDSENLIPRGVPLRDGTFPGFIKSEPTNNVNREQSRGNNNNEKLEPAIEDSLEGNMKRFQRLPIFNIAGNGPFNFPQLPQEWAPRNEVPYITKASNLPYGSNFQVITSYVHRPPYNMGTVNVERDGIPADVERKNSKRINDLGRQIYIPPDDNSMFLNPMNASPSKIPLPQSSPQDEINKSAGLSNKPQYPLAFQDWPSGNLPADIGGGRNTQTKDSESGIFSDYRLPLVRGDTNKQPTDENLKQQLLYPGTNRVDLTKQMPESLNPKWSYDRINDNSYPKIQDQPNLSGSYHSDPTQNRNNIYLDRDPSNQNYGVVTDENIKSSSRNLIGETYENLHDTRIIGTDMQKTQFDTEHRNVTLPTMVSQSLMDIQTSGGPQPDAKYMNANPETIPYTQQKFLGPNNKDTPQILEEPRQYKIFEDMAINSNSTEDFKDDPKYYTDSQPQYYRKTEAITETRRSALGSDNTIGSQHFNSQNAGQSSDTVIGGVHRIFNYYPGKPTTNGGARLIEPTDEKYTEEQIEERMKPNYNIGPTFSQPSGSNLANQKPLPTPSSPTDENYNTEANNQYKTSLNPKRNYPENELFSNNEVNLKAFGQRLFNIVAEKSLKNALSMPSYNQRPNSSEGTYNVPINNADDQQRSSDMYGKNQQFDEDETPYNGQYNSPFKANDKNLEQSRTPQLQKELIVYTTTDAYQPLIMRDELRPVSNMAAINHDQQRNSMNPPSKQNSVGIRHPLSPLTEPEQGNWIAEKKTKQYKITVQYPQHTGMPVEHNDMLLDTLNDDEAPAKDRTGQRQYNELDDKPYNVKQSISAFTTESDEINLRRSTDNNEFEDGIDKTTSPSPHKVPVESPNVLAGSNANKYYEAYGVNQSPRFPEQNTRNPFTSESTAGRDNKKGAGQYTITMYDEHHRLPAKTSSEVKRSENIQIPGQHDHGGLTSSKNSSPSLFDDENIEEDQYIRFQALPKHYNDGEPSRPYSTTRQNSIDFLPQTVNNNFDKRVNTTNLQGQYKVAVKFPTEESFDEPTANSMKPQNQGESQLINQRPTDQKHSDIQPYSITQSRTTDNEYNSTDGAKQYEKNTYEGLHAFNGARYIENTILPVEYHHQRLAGDGISATTNDKYKSSPDGSYPISSYDDGTKQYVITPYDATQKRPSKNSSTTGNTDLFEEYDDEVTTRNVNIPPNMSDKSRISKHDGVNVRYDTELSKEKVKILEQPYNSSHGQYIVAVKFISDGTNRRGSKLSQEDVVRGNVDGNVQASRTVDRKDLSSNRKMSTEDSTNQLLNPKETYQIRADQTNQFRSSPVSSSEVNQVLHSDRDESKIQDTPDTIKSATNNYGIEVEGEQLRDLAFERIKNILRPSEAFEPEFEMADAAYYRGRNKAVSEVDPKAPNSARPAIQTDTQINDGTQSLSKISDRYFVDGYRYLVRHTEDDDRNYRDQLRNPATSSSELSTLQNDDKASVEQKKMNVYFEEHTGRYMLEDNRKVLGDTVSGQRALNDEADESSQVSDQSNIATPASTGTNIKNEYTSSPMADRANRISHADKNDTTKQYRSTVNDEDEIYSLRTTTAQYQQNMELPLEYDESLLTQQISRTPYSYERLPTNEFRGAQFKDDNDPSRQKELFSGQPYKPSNTERYQDNSGWPVDYAGSIGNRNVPSNGLGKLPTNAYENQDVVYNTNQANQKDQSSKQREILPEFNSKYHTGDYETKKEYKIAVYDNDSKSQLKSTTARRNSGKTDLNNMKDPVEYERTTGNQNMPPNMSGISQTNEYDKANEKYSGNRINQDLTNQQHDPKFAVHMYYDRADQSRQRQPFFKQPDNEKPSSVSISPQLYDEDQLEEDGFTMDHVQFERSSKFASSTPSISSSAMVRKLINTRTTNDQGLTDQQRYMTTSSELFNRNNGENSTYPHRSFGDRQYINFDQQMSKGERFGTKIGPRTTEINNMPTNTSDSTQSNSPLSSQIQNATNEMAPDIRMKGISNPKYPSVKDTYSSSELPFKGSGQRFLESEFSTTKGIAEGRRQPTDSFSEITSDNSLIYKYYGSEKPLNVQEKARGVANSYQDGSKTSKTDPQLTQRIADNDDIGNMNKGQERSGRVTIYESPDDDIEFYRYLSQKGAQTVSTSDAPTGERGYYKPNDGSYSGTPYNQLTVSKYGDTNKLSSQPYHEEHERMPQLSNPLKDSADDAHESSERAKLTVDEKDGMRSLLSNDKINSIIQNMLSQYNHADGEKLNYRGIPLNEELGNVNTFEKYPYQGKSSLAYEMNDWKLEPQSLAEFIRRIINEKNFTTTTDSTYKYLESTKMSTEQSSNRASDPKTDYLYNIDLSTISKTQLPTNQRRIEQNGDAKDREAAYVGSRKIPDGNSGYMTEEVTNDSENTDTNLQVGREDRYSNLRSNKDWQNNTKNAAYKDDRQNFGSRNINNDQEGSLMNEKLQYGSKLLDKYSDQQYQDPNKLANAKDQDKNKVTPGKDESDDQKGGKPVMIPVSAAKTPSNNNGDRLHDPLMSGVVINEEIQANEHIKPNDIWISRPKGAVLNTQTQASLTFKGSDSVSTSKNLDSLRINSDHSDSLDNYSESYRGPYYGKFKDQPAVSSDHAPGKHILSKSSADPNSDGYTDTESEGNQLGSPHLLSSNSTDTERPLTSRLISHSQTEAYGTPMKTLVEISTARRVTNNTYTNGENMVSKVSPMSQVTSSPIVDYLMSSHIPVQRGYNNNSDKTEANKFNNSEANYLENTEATKEMNFDHGFLIQRTGVDHAEVADQTSSTARGMMILTRLGWKTVQESTSITSTERQSQAPHYQDQLLEPASRPQNSATTDKGTKADDHNLKDLSKSKPSDQGRTGSIKRGDNVDKYEERLHMDSTTSEPDFTPPNSGSGRDILEDNMQGSISDVTMTRTGWRMKPNSQQQLGADKPAPSLNRPDEPHKPSEGSLLKSRDSGLPNRTISDQDYTNQTNDPASPQLNIIGKNGDGTRHREASPKVSREEQEDDALGQLHLKTQPYSGQRILGRGTDNGNNLQTESPNQNKDKLKLPTSTLEKQINGSNVIINETSKLPAENRFNGDTLAEQSAHTERGEVHEDCSPGTNSNPTVVVQIVDRAEKEVNSVRSPRISQTTSSIDITEENGKGIISDQSPKSHTYSGQRALGEEEGDATNLGMKSPSQNKDGLPNSKSGNRPGETIQKVSSSMSISPAESTVKVSDLNDEVPCKHSSKNLAYSGQPSLDEKIGEKANIPLNSPSQNMKLRLVTLDKPSTNSYTSILESESLQKSRNVLETKDKVLANDPSKTQIHSGHNTLGEGTDDGINLPTRSVSQNTMVSTLALDEPSHSSILTKAKSENGFVENMQKMSSSSSTLKPENSIDVLEQIGTVHSSLSPNTHAYSGQRTLSEETDEKVDQKMESPNQNKLDLELPSGEPSTSSLVSNGGSGKSPGETIPKKSSSPNVLKPVSSIINLLKKLSSKPQTNSGKPNPGEEIGNDTNTPIKSSDHDSEKLSQPSVILSKPPNDSAVLKHEPESRLEGSSTFLREKSIIAMLKQAAQVLRNNPTETNSYSGQRALGEDDESEINQPMEPSSLNAEKSKLLPVTKDETSTISLVPKTESQSYPRESNQKVPSPSSTLPLEKPSDPKAKLITDPSSKAHSNPDQHTLDRLYLPPISPENPVADEKEYQHALRTLQNINSGNFKLFSSEYFIQLIQRCNCASLKFLIPILQKPNSGILVTT